MDSNDPAPFVQSTTSVSNALANTGSLPQTNAAFQTNRNFAAPASNSSPISSLMNAQLNNSTSNLGNLTNLNSGSPLTSDSFAVVNSLNKYVNNRTDLKHFNLPASLFLLAKTARSQIN